MKKIFEEYFFLDYTAADYFIGINGLEWYDKFTTDMKLYNAPKNLFLYYTEKDGKLYDEYIGKNPEIVTKIKEQLAKRKHYEKMLLELKHEQKAIEKIMGDLK